MFGIRDAVVRVCQPNFPRPPDYYSAFTTFFFRI